MPRLRRPDEDAAREAGRAPAPPTASTTCSPSRRPPPAGCCAAWRRTRSTQYLDYVNIMSYDLHGAWNQYVGPNAALYDDGNDAELAHWRRLRAPQYGGIGYLNTDWAYHYFRGSMPAGRINIGVPYYTRGCKNVGGGTERALGHARCRTRPMPARHRSRRLDGAVRQRRRRHRQPLARRARTARRSPPVPTRCGTPRTCRTAGAGSYIDRLRPRPGERPGGPAHRHVRPQLQQHAGRAVAVELVEAGVPVHRGRPVDRGQGAVRRRQGPRRHDDLGTRRRLRRTRQQRPRASTSWATR